MDEEKRNPSSADGVLADGSPPRSPASDRLVEAPRESNTVDEGVFVPSSNGGEESVSAALNADAFMSNILDLDIPIYEKMECVSLSGVPVATGEGPRQHPLSEDDDTDSDSESGETRPDDSESDESSSEDSDSSTSTGSSEDEEDEEEDDAASHGDGRVGIEEVPIGSEDEEEGLRCPVKSKHELEFLPPVPPVEVSLQPHHRTFPLGLISSVLGNRVIVEGSVNHNPLKEGSILWITETRIPLGIVDEIFGPVKNPYYVVRYNSEKDVPVGISEGTTVSFVMEFAAYVLDKDISKRGYDASGENDEEVSNEMEFSDDEKEAEYKRSLRQTKRGTDDFKFGNREKGTQKKKTRDKSTGANKNKIPTFSHGPEIVEQSGPGAHGPNKPSRSCNSGSVKSLASQHLASGSGVAQPASLAVNAVSHLATPSYQMSQHQNAAPGHAMPFLQQTNPSMPFRMPIPQQQQQTFWPPSVPMQQLQNVLLTHGMQQQLAAMTGLQMNLFLNQQLESQARLHQHQNNILMPSHPQIFQMLSTPNLPQIGINSSGALVSPALVGQIGIGQASLMPMPAVQGGSPMLGNVQSHGQPFLAAAAGQSAITDPMQFSPGSSSGSGRMPRRKGGGNSYKRGM